MPRETPHPKPGSLPRRRRYRTRMFDNRLSFPTTSEQVRQLQAESNAKGRSVASSMSIHRVEPMPSTTKHTR